MRSCTRELIPSELFRKLVPVSTGVVLAPLTFQFRLPGCVGAPNCQLLPKAVSPEASTSGPTVLAEAVAAVAATAMLAMAMAVAAARPKRVRCMMVVVLALREGGGEAPRQQPSRLSGSATTRGIPGRIP